MRALLIATSLTLLALPTTVPLLAAERIQGEVIRVRIRDEAITPVTARFIERALSEAEQKRAECLLIELDTPGGLLQSTQQIVTGILASRIPVVVYVSPQGARAASAGLFITISSHVAAMAPGTRIGAAHPVQFGGLPIGPQETPRPPDDKEDTGEQRRGKSAAEEKLVNDTEAWARGLADLRGRNQQWVATAVTESRVLLSSEAVEQGVVDFEAANLDDLLAQLDGREIPIGNTTVTLQTLDAEVVTVEMWWGERFLAVISNPNVVMLLLMFGVYGILFELYSPGWGVAGTLGVISLLLAFFGLSVLPVNYVGLALIVIALAMFAAEAVVTSYGALTVGGVICLTLGGMMLVDSPGGFLRVSLGVVVPVAAATGLIVVFLLSCIIRAQRQSVQTGAEALVDQHAVARGKFSPDHQGFRGQVFVHGEIWQARSSFPVHDGQEVHIRKRDGLTLEVETEEVASVTDIGNT